VADVTRWWHADSSVPYALAAIALFEHSRLTRDRFEFGPLSTEAMRDGGLSVSGSEDAVDRAARVLEGIPGLAEYKPD
jgi:hypothetical protein